MSQALQHRARLGLRPRCCRGPGRRSTAARADPARRHLTVVTSSQVVSDTDEDDPFAPARAQGTVTLAFAGDTHFQLHLAALLDHPRGALGPIAGTLGEADLTMVNLESAITERGTREAKDSRSPASATITAPPRALDLLAAAGVDVVTVANNHGADYGPVGLVDTLRRSHSPIPWSGSAATARRPSRRTGYRSETPIASSAPTLPCARAAARSGRPGRAPPASPPPAPKATRTLGAVRRRPTRRRRRRVPALGRGGPDLPEPGSGPREALAAAGADVIVGSHAHVQLGSGWLGNTYVNYGLGNFLWYHNDVPETGVLRVRVEDGQVVRPLGARTDPDLRAAGPAARRLGPTRSPTGVAA